MPLGVPAEVQDLQRVQHKIFPGAICRDTRYDRNSDFAERG